MTKQKINRIVGSIGAFIGIIVFIAYIPQIIAVFIEKEYSLATWQLLLVYLIPYLLIGHETLGLDNAATPTGLKAMQQMQELNTKKDTATNPMIMFLVLNTSGLTIIPTTILAFRASYVFRR